jgi:hypothetical protein
MANIIYLTGAGASSSDNALHEDDVLDVSIHDSGKEQKLNLSSLRCTRNQ